MEVEDAAQAEIQKEAILSLEDEAPVMAEVNSDEIEAVDEEEEAEVPLCLPAQYQPSLSEFLVHCVTHYPFRALCPHCLEGRGREFGHDNWKGTMDQSACPVVSFDYAFVNDHGEFTAHDGV